jgi:hypothetical protein
MTSFPRRSVTRRSATRPATLLVAFLVILSGVVALPGAGVGAEEVPEDLPTRGEATYSPDYVGAPFFAPGMPYTQNFPDPEVIFDPLSGRYYAFSTMTGGVYVPVMSSTDLVTWTARGSHGVQNSAGHGHDALPDPSPPGHPYVSHEPAFPDSVWAPAVGRFGTRWVMFYALQVDATGRRCIYYATSDHVDGPYRDPRFFTCSDDPMGSIDPDLFWDPATGVTYLLWKNEGRIGSHGQMLLAQPITLTSATTVGWVPGSYVSILLESQNTWERWVTENPSFARMDDGSLMLFYSGGLWDSSGYAVGVATCPEPTFTWGPQCTRRGAGPIMNTRSGRHGIGGSSTFRDANGALQIANHYWRDTAPASYPGNQRRLVVEQVHQVAGRLAISSEPGPAPFTGPASPVLVQPERILDTRTGHGTSPRRLENGEVVVADLSSHVTPSTTSVTLNVTVDATTAPGFVTAYGCGRPPNTSNINHTVSRPLPNLVTVDVSVSKKVCFYVHAATHLVVDLQGRYDQVATAGFTGVAPRRVLDTRDTTPVPQGGEVRVKVTGVAGVPADATAVSLNVTSDRSSTTGYLSVWPCDTPRPEVSSVNYTPGSPSSNAVLVPVSASGEVCVYSHVRTDVIADVFGYVGATGARYDGITPNRLLDTRQWGWPAAGYHNVPVQVIGAGAAPPGTTSVVLTVTATEPWAPGFVSAFACASQPAVGQETSVVNVNLGETRSAHVTVPVGPDGLVCLRAQPTTHLLVDLVGAYA